MEITGKVIEVLPMTSGTSKSGNAWRKLEFIVLTDEKYNKKCKLHIFGDAIDKFQIAQGIVATFHIDISCRDPYTDGKGVKRYPDNDVRVWKVSAPQQQNFAPQNQQQPMFQQQPQAYQQQGYQSQGFQQNPFQQQQGFQSGPFGNNGGAPFQ